MGPVSQAGPLDVEKKVYAKMLLSLLEGFQHVDIGRVPSAPVAPCILQPPLTAGQVQKRPRIR